MELALLLGALALGLAGVPHCVAMCATPCAAVCGPRALGPAGIAFHAGRLLSYAAAGALVAGGVQLLGSLSAWSPLLRPAWTLLHAAALVLGLWLLWQGRQPLWLETLGRGSARAAALHGGGRMRLQAPLRRAGAAGAAGALWAAWPCGLLQSALVLAALAKGPGGGALVMAGFAAVTAGALMLGPALWSWLGVRGMSAQVSRWAVRASGGLIALAALFALTRSTWADFVAWCVG